MRTTADAVAAARGGGTLLVTGTGAARRSTRSEAVAGTATDLVLLDPDGAMLERRDRRRGHRPRRRRGHRALRRVRRPGRAVPPAPLRTAGGGLPRAEPTAATVCFPAPDGEPGTGALLVVDGDRRVTALVDAGAAHQRAARRGRQRRAGAAPARAHRPAGLVRPRVRRPRRTGAPAGAVARRPAAAVGRACSRCSSRWSCVVAALWRGRRLGPLVDRAAAGHRPRRPRPPAAAARLYRRSRAYGHAAAALRAGAARRCGRPGWGCPAPRRRRPSSRRSPARPAGRPTTSPPCCTDHHPPTTPRSPRWPAGSTTWRARFTARDRDPPHRQRGRRPVGGPAGAVGAPTGERPAARSTGSRPERRRRHERPSGLTLGEARPAHADPHPAGSARPRPAHRRPAHRRPPDRRAPAGAHALPRGRPSPRPSCGRARPRARPRSPRPSSGRTRRSPGWSSRCCAAATCCSRACPAWPRRCSCGRCPPRSTWRPSASSSRPTSCPATSPARSCTTRGPRSSRSARARCSPTCCWPTRSTGRRPRPRRRCSRRWRSGRSAWTASRARCPTRSWSSRPRTRSSTRAPTRCPRPSSTGSCSSSCCRCPSATRRSRCSRGTRAGFDPRDLRGAGVRPVAGRRRPRARPGPRSPGSQVAREVLGYAVDVCRATRQSPSLSLGVSPRGATALLATARAWAWLSGRGYVTPGRHQGARAPDAAAPRAAARRGRARGRHGRERPGHRAGRRAGPPLTPAAPTATGHGATWR